MKEITVDDCVELQNKFNAYLEKAETHEFPILAIMDARLSSSVDGIVQAGEVKDQRDARAMFRVILNKIGEDSTDYQEAE